MELAILFPRGAPRERFQVENAVQVDEFPSKMLVGGSCW